MRVATFNINNIVSRLAVLTAWLEAEQPDVVCLQELKADQGAFPLAAIEALGYQAWRGQRTWNGVAILARGMTPIVTRTALPGDPDKSQVRYIEAAVNGVLVGRLYLPNGNPLPGPKFDDKLAWFECFIAHAQTLVDTGAPVILAGDYNVVPTEADIYPHHSYAGNALLRPESRAAFARLLDQGWTDALRAVHPDGPLWTFWSYLRFRLAQGQGHAPGSSLAVAETCPATRRRRCRSLGARPGGRERPRPRLDRAGPMSPPVTPDGRYFVVRGRLWRCSRPDLAPEHRQALVVELMTARRAVRAALAAEDPAALAKARAGVQTAKVALGERGPAWWSNGAPDLNRHMASNTPYAAWFASLDLA